MADSKRIGVKQLPDLQNCPGPWFRAGPGLRYTQELGVLEEGKPETRVYCGMQEYPGPGLVWGLFCEAGLPHTI